MIGAHCSGKWVLHSMLGPKMKCGLKSESNICPINNITGPTLKSCTLMCYSRQKFM